MGRPKTAVAPGAVAGDLAEFLHSVCARCGKTYAQISIESGISISTLSRAASGKRRPKLEVVQAFVRACGGSPSELRKAERLWRRTPAASSSASPDGQPGVRWHDPASLCEAHHLGEAMRTALRLSGSPSLRAVSERATALGLSLSRSTLGDALRPGAVPTLQVFCVFMQVIGHFPGSPVAGYDAAAWEDAWVRVQARRQPRARGGGPGSSGVKVLQARGGRAKECGGRRAGGRRPRLAQAQAWVRPGPLRVLKDWLHELYLEAGAPSLTDITASIRMDDSLDSAPKRDSVNRLLRSSHLLSVQGDAVAVAVAMARMAGLDPVAAGGMARELWISAAAVRPWGHAVGDVVDPLALGVRETFALPESRQELPVLVPYVRRQHDQVLERIVERAVDGHSALVVARGLRATGKTRSCWEAMQALPAGWRIWFPADPSKGALVVEAIAQAGPGSVVWLDRIDRYLDPGQCHVAGMVQAEISEALHDPRRAPVLVIGTVSASAGVLTRAGGSTSGAATAARTMIEDAAVDVPDLFTGAELADLADAAGQDPRLALADANARGSVAQFLSTNRNADPLLKVQVLHTAMTQGDTDALLMGGALLQASGHRKEAATWYQRAAEAGDRQALEPAAVLLSENGTAYEAIAWLRDLAATGDAEAALTAARRLSREGRNDEAIEFYQQAARAGGSSHALRAAAALMQRSGRAAEAVEWLRGRAAAGDASALRETAHVLWATGDVTRAVTFYSEAGAAGDVGAWREGAERLQSLGRDDEAIMMYRAAVRKGDGLSARPLADLLLSEGRREEALGFYLQAAEQGDAVAMHQAAALYRLAGRVEEALQWYGRAADQGDTASLVHIGVMHRGRGDIEAALAAFTKAADLRERDAYREAVWMLWDCGRLDRAFNWLGHRADTGDRRAVREMADLLREVGRLPEALEWYLRSAGLGSLYAARHAAQLQSLMSARETEQGDSR